MNAESDDATVLRLIDRIRRRIGEAQTSQDDRELLEHFKPVPHQLDTGVTDHLLRQIDHLRHLRQSLPPFPDTSRVPGGRHLHRLIGKSVRRDTAVLAERIDTLTNQIAASLDALFYALNRLDAERSAYLDEVRATERARMVDSLDRLWASHEASLHDLTALHETLEYQSTRQDSFEARLALFDSREGGPDRGTAAHAFRPEFSSLAFAERFRGSREDILLRYDDVAEVALAPGGPVLDLGCGRGELVELIVAKGGSARGVEVDPELVDFCRSLFLDVTQSSALDALNNADDESLGCVALIQVVEHLKAQELALLVPVALRKLQAGGLFVAETVNGTSPFVFTRSFFCDPTHTNPVHHEYLQFLLEQSGFVDTRVEWRSLVDISDRLSEIPEGPYRQAAAPGKRIVKDTNSRLQQLDQFLFGPQDYLIVARK